MHQKSELQLIIVVNSAKMELYEAEKNKITRKIQEDKLHLEHHHHHTKNKAQLEGEEAAKEAVKYLEQLLNGGGSNKYNEVILIAEAQMLGKLRKLFSNNLKQIITKEFTKDLVGHDINSIESTAF